jgi:branched-chain amino acid transport system permease protein
MDAGLIFVNAISAMIGPTALVYALAAIGLNIQFGYTGLLNFGQAAFAAVGSYGLAVVAATYAGSVWLGLLAGLGGAAVLALLLGVSTLRLRADYLAIVTIAAAEIVRRMFRAGTFADYTGGSDGMRGFAGPFFDISPFDRGYRLVFGPLNLSGQDLWVMTIGWPVVGLLVLLVWLAMRSPWGRVLRAIREDEDAARSLGKNVFSYKMQSLVLGGMVGGLAGFFYALSRANVQPDNYSTDFTFFLYTILILGGAARVFSPVVGAMIFWFLFNFLSRTLEQIEARDIVPDAVLRSTQVGPMVNVLVGAGLVLMLIFRPQGIFGDKREIALDVR